MLAAEASSGGFPLLAVLGTVLTVVLAAAGSIGAWAALRVGKNTQVVGNYKATAESWEARAEALETTVSGLNEELESEKAARQRERQQSAEIIAALQSKVGTLQDLVTGQHAVDVLSAQVNDHFTALSGKLDGLRTEVQQITFSSRRQPRTGHDSSG